MKIYQIKDAEETIGYQFLGLSSLSKIYGTDEVDSSIYECVYEGDLGTSDPEEIYALCNTRHPEGYRGHSLSVSDVVEIDGKFFFCDTYGFKEIAFCSLMKEGMDE